VSSEEILYAWVVCPDSLDIDTSKSNTIFTYIFWIFHFTYNVIYLIAETISNSEVIFPFIISFTLLSVLITFFMKTYCVRKAHDSHSSSGGSSGNPGSMSGGKGKKFWILRRENPNMDNYVHPESMVSSGVSSSSS
jgi:hypothetical protein